MLAKPQLKAFELADELKTIMRPLYNKHQDDIITGEFSKGMMAGMDLGGEEYGEPHRDIGAYSN